MLLHVSNTIRTTLHSYRRLYAPRPFLIFPTIHTHINAHTPSLSLSLSLSLLEITEFIKELDSDGDGGVSWEEYVQGLFSQDLDDGEMPEELAAALGTE